MAETNWAVIDHVKPAGDLYRLRLYVAGAGPRSLRAVRNLTRICEAELAGRYNLEIVDIHKEPERATKNQIIAIPTLVKESPAPLRRILGDLSETAQLREGLGI